MPRRTLTALLLLSLALSATACNRRGGKDPKDKIDDIPRGTGGTPATQLTRPG